MELYPHQKRALEATSNRNHVAYYLDMGLGKTFVGSEKMRELDADVNLVVCQKSKIQDWIEHFKTYYPQYMALNLTSKNGLMPFISWSHANVKIIGVINYELAWRRKELLELHDFTLMLDESSLIQNTSAKQTKFILKLKPSNVILLSGTPTAGKYENLWSQAHLLGWNISESLFQSHYVNYELMEDSIGFKHWIVSKENPYKNVDRLKQKFRDNGAVFMKTEECFDLPEQTFITVKCGVPKEYKRFMKDSIVQIGDLELVGDTVLTKRLYSRQIASLYNKSKWQSFIDLLESTNDRLIVFYNFNAECDRMRQICDELNRPVSIINGSEKRLESYENEPDSVTLVQYQAGSMGLNLQKANKIIYFSLCERSELFEQSKKRIHRIGQNQPCYYYLLMAQGSIDYSIYSALLERKDFTDELFQEILDHGNGGDGDLNTIHPSHSA